MATSFEPLTESITYLTPRKFAIKAVEPGRGDGVSSLRDDKSVGEEERKQPTLEYWRLGWFPQKPICISLDGTN
jgi:hypothetical protein